MGDLALYLVTRGMKASDLLSNSNSIDWPDSVVGLLRGEIGLPHRGFPPAVEAAILKVCTTENFQICMRRKRLCAD